MPHVKVLTVCSHQTSASPAPENLNSTKRDIIKLSDIWLDDTQHINCHNNFKHIHIWHNDHTCRMSKFWQLAAIKPLQVQHLKIKHCSISATAFGIVTLSEMTFSTITFKSLALSVISLSKRRFGLMTLSISFFIMTLGIFIFGIMTIRAACQSFDSWQLSNLRKSNTWNLSIARSVLWVLAFWLWLKWHSEQIHLTQ